MNYEQKYKEALERAKNLHKDAIDMGENIRAKQCEIIFPELKEDEDERIRKTLIEYFNVYPKDYYGELKKSHILAWLEKQGEQNPYSGASFKYNGHTFGMCARDGGAEILIDGNLKAFISLDKSFIYPVIPIPSFKAENFYVSKVDGLIHDSTYNSTEKHEPKFHNGDWVTDGYLHCKISDVLDDRYIVDTKFAKRSTITFKCENNYHLWTIQDAKDGDVLVNGSNIFIFHFINATRLMGYCHVNTDDGRFYNDIGKNECFCLIDAVVTPATKSQRDTLFTKMKEAGYEWDAEKKELKIIDWSKHVKYEPNGPSIIDENTEWSEEDEKNLIEVISIVQNISSYDKQYDGYVNWLKSIRQRIGE